MTPKATLAIILGLCAFISFLAKDRLETRAERPLKYRPALLPMQASYQGDSLRRFSFGMDNLLADLLWIQLLQKANHEPITDGRVSWEYAQLDAITRLDRRFERVFRFGTSFLSVFRRDKLGAKALLERWVELEPWTWRSHYTLGYHLYFEMGDERAAAGYILRAASMEGAPEWLPALGVRLLSDTGALAQALNFSIELYRDIPSEVTRHRLTARIRSIRYTLQKLVWQRALEQYRAQHKREPAALSSLAPLVSVGELRSLATVDGPLPPEIEELMAESFSFRYDPNNRKIVPLRPESVKGLEQVGIYRGQSS